MTLSILPWQENASLLATPVLEATRTLPENLILGVTQNSDELADTYKWAEAFDMPLTATANVVIVETRKTRNAERKFAAVLVLASTKADLNGAVKKHLGVSKISFAPYEKATEATGMESGGMSPIGLPSHWPLIVDTSVTKVEKLYIGSGIRPSKLVVSGAVFSQLPGAQIADVV